MRPLRLSIFGTLALATTLAGGCAKSPSTTDFPDDPAPSTPNNPNNPNAPMPTPTPTVVPKYAGVYEANALLDFTQPGVLPGLASPLLGALSKIHDQPGTAIVDFANAANVPVIKDIGSFGRALLAGILNTQIGQFYTSNPDLNQVAQVIMDIFEISKTTVLLNKLTVHTPAADGTVATELQLAGARFEFFNNKIDVMTPVAAQAAAKTSMTATLKARANAPIADADLTLTGGTVKVPAGEFILQALGPALFQPKFGTSDLKQTLLKLVPCNDFASDVASAAQQDDFLKYFITEPVVKTICNTAVGYLADKVTNEIKALTIDNVAIANGRAVLYDISQMKPTMDHQSDRVADGTWTWSFGATEVPSTLVGDRVGVAQ
jgi:hypothetical protein